VQGVLGRTTGSACEKACAQLPDLADGRLADLDRQLVQAHLEHCTACRAVAVALGWLDPLLPELAELDPGPAFTAAVVRRTTGAEHSLTRAARRGETVGPAGLMDRAARWWRRLLFRPRFALEAAYVATVILVLLASVPGAPLRQPARLAGEVIQAGPMALPGVNRVLDKGQDLTDAGSSAVRRKAQTGVQGLQQEWNSRRERAAAPGGDLINHIETAWAQMRAAEWNQTAYQLLEAGRDLNRTWSLWWHDDTQGMPELTGETAKEQS